MAKLALTGVATSLAAVLVLLGLKAHGPRRGWNAAHTFLDKRHEQQQIPWELLLQ
jgi:hypothetical protein